jgi:ABC-type transport system involved in multi-copper enzyme maturation permease subunit
MRRFQLLLFNTIQKEFRSKTLVLISIITLAVILLINAGLNFLSKEVLSQIGQEGAAQGTTMALIFIISKFTSLLSIIFGVNCIKSDIETNVSPLLMSFPISRMEYLLARILGSWIIIMVYYLFSVVVAQLLLSSSIGSIVGGPHLLGAMFYTALSNLIVIMISAFLGLNMPKIMALLMTSFVTIIVTASNMYLKGKEWSEMTSELEFFPAFAFGLHMLFPRMGVIDDIGRNILMQKEVDFNIGIELAHFGVTTVFFFWIFYYLFNRREI